MASNLTRFEPFGDISRLNPLRTIDELFRELTPRGMLRELQQSEPMINVEVTENDQTYTVRAEIPGVKKDDIKVDVRGNRVSITAETKREQEQKEGNRLLRSELYYGQMSRTIMLEQEVDDTKAQAKYNDGVLELTLPKRAPAGGSKLQIQ
ncbi:Hsp20/alpha crystallin family protein [Massilia horti]|uniref:Hsp20/alpha crystallin family protein n=1 Tax=Massilia horti TaxID=2562153 RepID=A0A4Y9SXZ6_9BURK|nr:Hsp20/alpha crystallin family protein [Massilia horti]TFW31302.1 Hsp20/alpha crystallin family protein [Massilia horti]